MMRKVILSKTVQHKSANIPNPDRARIIQAIRDLEDKHERTQRVSSESWQLAFAHEYICVYAWGARRYIQKVISYEILNH